jgi:hypothetical protein
MSVDHIGRIALLWRGDREMRAKATATNNRLRGVFDALARLGVTAEPAVYADDMVDEVREQLMRVDGVLVWVDPISDGHDRSRLDPLLREVAAHGAWVSAHPDVILKMGTKEVLHRTRHLGWGTDTHLYRTIDELRERLPARLASAPRVLKQNRGNGGIGTFKIKLMSGSSSSGDAMVRVLEARRDSVEETQRLDDFIIRCEPYFAFAGRMIEQPFVTRLPEGQIRCYLAGDKVAGFAHQLVRALMPAPKSGESPLPGPRIMYGASEPAFRALRTKMESEWVPAMMREVGLDAAFLPAIWDADFLYGPKSTSGEDTYVLNEINVSAVFPFPDQALEPLAHAAVSGMLAARERRGGIRT